MANTQRPLEEKMALFWHHVFATAWFKSEHTGSMWTHIQMLRDRLTFAMMVGIPIIQLTLFGYAINADPRALPTAVVVADNGTFARSIVRALENTTYFRVVAWPDTLAQAGEMIARGEVQFVVDIPTDFSRRVLRGEKPAMLVEADATDPVATGNALAALAELNQTALAHDLIGPLRSLQPGQAPFEVRIHRRYNPEGITEYNIVPGLMGTILTMTLAMITAAAVTREFERGTMENLLATPVRPLEGISEPRPHFSSATRGCCRSSARPFCCSTCPWSAASCC
jgi:ABC-2 type transport system permease protein